MKRNSIAIAALAAFAFASCSKDVKVPVGLADEAQTAKVTFGIGMDGGTKSDANIVADLPYESKVNSVQFILTSHDDIYTILQDIRIDSSSVTRNVPLGEYDVYAFVNKNNTNFPHYEEPYSNLSDNTYTSDTEGNFVMIGQSAIKVTESGASVAVPVERTVSRVTLKQVKNEFYGHSVTLSHVWISNIPQNILFEGIVLSDDNWYNWCGRNESGCVLWQYDDYTHQQSLPECQTLTSRSLDEQIASGESISPENLHLYCHPNYCKNLQPGLIDKEGNSEASVLVIEAGIDDNGPYYYPVVLNKGLQNNKTYNVSLTIRSFGSDDPNTPVSKNALAASVVVNDWVSGGDYNETI